METTKAWAEGLERTLSALSDSKKDKQGLKVRSLVYIFVSFDLTNSTKFKYRNPNWLDMIKELIKTANNYWFGLDFWKFNGDELLYYTELISFSQLVLILHKLNDAANDIEKELFEKMHDDKSGIGFEADLIGIKTAVWIAAVSDDNNSLNSKLSDFDSVDFAGINMDEGFRMSKCATQSKIVVDPKIALIVTAIANELIGKRIHNLTNNEIAKIKELPHPTQFEDVFAKYWLLQDKKNFEHDVKDMFKVVANNFRLIGYKNCKGVWDERPYPVIWYSDDWDSSIANVKYDETYNDINVDWGFINHYYGDEKNSFKITFERLKKIFSNISAYSMAINQILLKSNIQLYSNLMLEKHIVSKTYLYYSIVCVNEASKGVLVFLRSKDRGHMPHVWDFDSQKNANDTYGESMIKQIEQRIKKNFDLNVKITADEKRMSVLPVAIQPIYRKGKMHHGIVCEAKIVDELSEIEIIDKIKCRLPEIKTGYGYPLYEDVIFVHNEQCFSNEDLSERYLFIDEKKIYELSNAETSSDSSSWQNHNKVKQTENRCSTNMVITIKELLENIEPQNEQK